MKLALAVMAGGALGSLLRYLLSVWFVERWGDTFPWGTFFVNVVGSFGIGLFASLTPGDGLLSVSPTAKVFVMMGIFGGFTTFSSFSLQTLLLAREGAWIAAGGYVVASVVLCLAAVWLGDLAGSATRQLVLR